MTAPDFGTGDGRAGPLLFLSHAGPDAEAARRLKRRIEEAPEARAVGLRVWLDKDDLLPGGDWQRQLEDAIGRSATAFAVYVGAGGVVNWVEAEVRLALSRVRRGDGFPFIPVIAAGAESRALPGFAQQFQGVRDVEGSGEEFQKLLAAVLGRGEAGRIIAEQSPFPGLVAIDEERSHLFFGREEETGELVSLLRQTRLLMVVGDSGSGKSSLVRAGLVPQWRGGKIGELEGRQPDEHLWHVIEFWPRSDPRHELSNAVDSAAQQLGVGFDDRVAMAKAAKEGSADSVRRALRCGLPPDRTRTLVVVDQFEELVTATPASERRSFVELLLRLADPANEAFSVALTMRRDYYNLLSASECKPLYDRLEADGRKALYPLGRMKDEGLRRIVTEPLRLAGVGNDERETLAEAVLRDVGDRPGDLALVQFALFCTWPRHRKFGHDLLRAYADVGRVDGALAGGAGRVYEQLLGGDANGAEVAATLIRLARLDGTAGPTRRIARRREFSDERWSNLQKLASGRGNRLVLIRQRRVHDTASVGDGEEVAELAHEALLTRWEKLHAWLNEAPEDKRKLDRLADRAAEWADARTAEEKDKRLARTDAEREDFDALRTARPRWLSDEEHAFVEASVRDHEMYVKRSRQQRRLLRASAVCALFLALVATGAGVIAQKQAAEAQKQAAEARKQTGEALAQRSEALAQRSRFLAPLSRQQTAAGDGMSGMLIALEALDLLGEPPRVQREAVRGLELALYSALVGNRELRILPPQIGLQAATAGARLAGTAPERVTAVRFSPDGRRVLVAWADGSLSTWDGETGALLRRLGGDKPMALAAFEPKEGVLAATVTEEGEVHLWDTNTGQELKVLPGEGEAPTALGFSPNGRILAAASDSGAVRLWEVATGRPIRAFRDTDRRSIKSVALSPDADRVLIVPEGGSPRLLEVGETGGNRDIAGGSGGAIAADFDFSPDGASVVAIVAIWADGTWTKEAVTPPGDQPTAKSLGAPVRYAAFSPDRKSFVTVTGDQTARTWHAETGEGTGKPIRESEGEIVKAVFGPDGHSLLTLAAGSSMATSNLPYPVRLWDVQSGNLVATFRGHSLVAGSAQFSPDGTKVVTGSDDGTARIWDARPSQAAASMTYRRTLVGKMDAQGFMLSRTGNDRAFAFTSAPERLVVASPDRRLELWDVRPGPRPDLSPLDPPFETEIVRVAAHPRNGSQIAGGALDGEVRVWDTNRSGQPLRLRQHRAAVSTLVYAGDGRLLMAASLDGTASLWNPDDGTLQAVLDGHAGPVLAAALSPDGRHAATGTDGRTAQLWSVPDGKLVRTFEHPEGAVLALAFDGRGHLLTGSKGGTARIWDVPNPAMSQAIPPEPIHVLQHEGMVTAVRSSSQTRRVLTACEDGAAHLWDADTGARVLAIKQGSGAHISSALFLPGRDGGDELILTAAHDGSVELHDGDSGALVATLNGHRKMVTGVALSRDGRLLATGSPPEGSVRLWSLPPQGRQELVREAVTRRTRTLSQEDRKRFFLSPDGRLEEAASR